MSEKRTEIFAQEKLRTSIEREPERENVYLKEFHFESKPDRHGTKGEVHFAVDWRPRKIEISYLPEPLQRNLDYFTDDHQRSLNAQIAGGGRDMRTFSLPEFEEKRRAREQELRKEYLAIYHQLQERLRPSRIVVEVSSRMASYTTENYQGDLSENYYSVFKLAWMDYSAEFSDSPRQIIKKTYEEHGSEEKNRVIREQLMQEGNEEARKYLMDRLDALKTLEDSPEIRELQRRYRELEEESRIFHGEYFVRIPIYLYKDLTKEEVAASVNTKTAGKGFTEGQIRPERSFRDSLEDLGSGGTRGWYDALGIDLNAPSLEFPRMDTTIAHVKLSDLRERMKERLIAEKKRKETELRKQEKEAQEKARIEKIAREEEERRIRVANIEAELTPEIKEKIVSQLDRLEAFTEILLHLPQTSPERSKFIASLPKGLVSGLRNDFNSRKKGIEILDDISRVNGTLEQYADRKKINDEVPSLKKKALNLVQEWSKIKAYIEYNDEALMVIEEGVVSKEELQKRVSDQFLENPWEQDPRRILKEIVTDLVEGL